MNYINIMGTGKALPSHEVTASMIDKQCNLAEGTTLRITSLEKRYFLKDESASTLILNAIHQALDNATLKLDDIDCIIAASATMQQAIPYNGAGIHRLLKPKRNIPSFDINMTCLSALRAFDIASNLLGSYPTILIVSCDIASIGLDWSDIRTAGIFGDGATAMIVQKSTQGGIVISNFETYSEGFEYCQIEGGGSKNPPSTYSGDYNDLAMFRMDGKKLFKLSAKILPDFIHNTLRTKGLTLKDIDYIVPHQASQASLNHMVRMLKIDKNKLIDIFHNHGNQVATSIPTALHELFMTKDLKSGQRVMLVGTSAGVGLGLVVWEVP
ncbi:MAG: 3-oxoacyl-(Acyl-carrier-protein) synthase III [uncultured Sulfurovum sp.]|uniref:3-oxoacyl-(Acyl-carrier-protein) synthase III n=1 Tax=uncultured Sulfurovum sp. TaxID=269237 RepID=A0A6S6SGI0_9BACT|nr:MAG: 3-oxoacyl-(Acyl-carrier-protein) synthase III [uncultured Sulfurovum sp.]